MLLLLLLLVLRLLLLPSGACAHKYTRRSSKSEPNQRPNEPEDNKLFCAFSLDSYTLSRTANVRARSLYCRPLYDCSRALHCTNEACMHCAQCQLHNIRVHARPARALYVMQQYQRQHCRQTQPQQQPHYTQAAGRQRWRRDRQQHGRVHCPFNVVELRPPSRALLLLAAAAAWLVVCSRIR